eukprot:7476643-Pyramimonas_sp.AAC.1
MEHFVAFAVQAMPHPLSRPRRAPERARVLCDRSKRLRRTGQATRAVLESRRVRKCCAQGW